MLNNLIVGLFILSALVGCTKPKVDEALSASANLDIESLVPTAITDGTFSNTKTESPKIEFSTPPLPEGFKVQAQVIKSNNFSTIKSWTDIESGQNISGLSLADGSQYGIKLRIAGASGNYSQAILSDGWIVDATAPTAPSTIQDGTTNSSLIETPVITFSSSNDGVGSGVAKYLAQVILASDDSVIKAWGDLTSGGKLTGLTLTNGSSYKLQVKAVDRAGNESTVTTSDGWTASIVIQDSTPPTAPSAINDGSIFNSTSSSPVISFTLGTDSGSGIQKHQAQVIKASDQTVVKDWFDFTTGTAITGLSLTSGLSYKVKLRAIDVAGNISGVATSDGWSVDSIAPAAPTSIVDGGFISSTSVSPTISFTLGTDVGGSGIQKHQAKIIRNSDSTVVMDWFDFSSGGTVTGLTLTDGTTYIVKVRAVDLAGNNSSEAAGDGWTVDVSPPSAPSSLSHATSSSSLTTSPAISFTAGVDGGSGVLKHQARVIKASDESVIKDWFDFTSGSTIGSLTLTNDTLYKVQIKAIDNLNQVSSISTSTGWTPHLGGVTVNWTANKEKAVNSSGGGYKVYYSQTSGFNINTASFVNVPYVSGASAPTSTTIPGLLPGTWYIKIVAFSAINGGSQSAVSGEASVVVP